MEHNYYQTPYYSSGCYYETVYYGRGEVNEGGGTAPPIVPSGATKKKRFDYVLSLIIQIDEDLRGRL